MTPIKLFSSVGYDEDNDPNDIVETGTALATLGRLDALDAARSGEFGDGLDHAIRAYQSDNDLERDGVLYPDGPTQQSINDALKAHRPGPSLLPSEEAAEDTGFGKSALPLPIRARARDDLAEGRRPESLSTVLDRRDSHAGLEISDRAARKLAAGQRTAARLLDSWANAAADSLGADGGDMEQIMKSRGARYVPDPMGRIGEGDWIDEDGRRLTADQVSQIAARVPSPPIRWRNALERRLGIPPSDRGVAVQPARPGALHRRIESSFDSLAHDLSTAAAYVRRGEPSIRIALPGLAPVSSLRGAETAVPRINAAIREAVVANALLHRATSPDEIASVIKTSIEDPAHGPPETGRSRVEDMLIEAAANGATNDQRLHAKGLLAVYDMERGEAVARGDGNPAERADAALNRFIADQSGEVPWAVYDPEQDDDIDVEPVGDDPDEKKPRGMRNAKTRAAVEQGKVRHKEAHEAFRDRGWQANERIPRSKLRPDGITKDGKPIEVKPDTESGRKAGEKQIRKHNEATRQHGRVIYYSPDGAYSGFRGGLGGFPRGGSGPGPFSK